MCPNYNSNLDFFFPDDLGADLLVLPEEDHPPVARTDQEINGISVEFPFDPYPCQLAMMDTILSTVSASQNCLVESATGTGKTLALVCSLLAWQKEQEIQARMHRPSSPDGEEEDAPHIPIIIYATRTLAHIQQIVDQLRLTSYADTPMGIYASMVQVCNNHSTEPLPNGTPGSVPAAAMADNHFCRYNPEDFKWADYINNQNVTAWNIPNVKEFCRGTGTCPYYEMLDATNYAKIIFCTFNYLLHSGIRQAMEIDLNNKILVFDEGHNVEELSREVASTQPESLTLTKVTDITSVLLEALASPQVPEVKKDPLRNLSTTFTKLRDFLASHLSEQRNNSRPIQIVFQDALRIFAEIGLGPDNLSKLWMDYFTLEDRSDVTDYIPEVARFKIERKTMRQISNALFALGFLWEGNPNFLNSDSYKILLRTALFNEPSFGNDIELKLICLNPAVGFKGMNAARSVIIASGTLSPLESFSSELGIPFAPPLSAGHVIPPDQVFTALIDRHSPDRSSLYLSSDSWDSNPRDYEDQLLKIIEDICLVPHGVVVFMPSKDRVKDLKTAFRKLRRLNAFQVLQKRAFFETDCEQGDQEGLHAMLHEYRTKANTRDGAILFAVMRGSLSEGIDFRDNHARALVTIGIPFKPPTDLFVEAKREYQDERSQDGNALSGWEWYAVNAFKALNQAIGRSVRHSKDWGAIFIVDSRLSRTDYFPKLPEWVRESGENNGIGPLTDVLPSLDQFLRRFE